jgi:hypothetical protein
MRGRRLLRLLAAPTSPAEGVSSLLATAKARDQASYRRVASNSRGTAFQTAQRRFHVRDAIEKVGAALCTGGAKVELQGD